MSAEATGWVWRNSPCEGSQLLVHLAIADVVNDIHGNEFWMSTYGLAKKARVGRSTVVSTLSDLVKAGMLEVLKEGKRDRTPTRYRFVFLGQSAEGLGQSEAVTRPEVGHRTQVTQETEIGASAVVGLVPSKDESAPPPEDLRDWLRLEKRARQVGATS